MEDLFKMLICDFCKGAFYLSYGKPCDKKIPEENGVVGSVQERNLRGGTKSCVTNMNYLSPFKDFAAISL
jgi:hypothetical protein